MDLELVLRVLYYMTALGVNFHFVCISCHSQDQNLPKPELPQQLDSDIGNQWEWMLDRVLLSSLKSHNTCHRSRGHSSCQNLWIICAREERNHTWIFEIHLGNGLLLFCHFPFLSPVIIHTICYILPYPKSNRLF